MAATRYREWAAPPPLRHAVACLWSHEIGPGSQLVLPDGCTDLIWRSDGAAFVAGPDTGPDRAAMGEGTRLVGLRFHPGAGAAGLGVPLAEVREQRVDVDDLDLAMAAALHPDLRPEEAASTLVRVVGQRLDEARPDPVVREAVALLSDPRADLAAVSRSVGLSGRQLRRRFLDGVGYGPKTLQRVLRFRTFLDAAVAGDLAGSAARAGYADQSHLNRECQDLAGMTPASLVACWH